MVPSEKLLKNLKIETFVINTTLHIYESKYGLRYDSMKLTEKKQSK